MEHEIGHALPVHLRMSATGLEMIAIGEFVERAGGWSPAPCRTRSGTVRRRAARATSPIRGTQPRHRNHAIASGTMGQVGSRWIRMVPRTAWSIDR
jgi:hypothetical protein